MDTDQLLPEGKKLIHDTHNIVETARLIIKEKNADELLQKLVSHTEDVSLDGAKVRPEEILPSGRERMEEDSKAGA